MEIFLAQAEERLRVPVVLAGEVVVIGGYARRLLARWRAQEVISWDNRSARLSWTVYPGRARS